MARPHRYRESAYGENWSCYTFISVVYQFDIRRVFKVRWWAHFSYISSKPFSEHDEILRALRFRYTFRRLLFRWFGRRVCRDRGRWECKWSKPSRCWHESFRGMRGARGVQRVFRGQDVPENVREYGSVGNDDLRQDKGLHPRLHLRGRLRAGWQQRRLHRRKQLSPNETLTWSVKNKISGWFSLL